MRETINYNADQHAAENKRLRPRVPSVANWHESPPEGPAFFFFFFFFFFFYFIFYHLQFLLFVYQRHPR